MTSTLPQPAQGSTFFGKRFGSAWIVSVFWGQKQASLANRSRVLPGGRVIPAGFNDYVLGPAPRDGYSLLRVDDAAPHIPDFSGGDDDRPGMTYAPQAGADVAQSLVDRWSNHGSVGSGRPGIAVLPEEEMTGADEEGRPIPSAAFLARLRSEQEPYANGWVDKAADLFRSGNAKQITETHRNACRWLHGEAANRFEWMHQRGLEANKRCAACSREILQGARVCEHCHTNLAKFYLDSGYTVEEIAGIDPPVADDMRRASARREVKKHGAAKAHERLQEFWAADAATKAIEDQKE